MISISARPESATQTELDTAPVPAADLSNDSFRRRCLLCLPSLILYNSHPLHVTATGSPPRRATTNATDHWPKYNKVSRRDPPWHVTSNPDVNWPSPILLHVTPPSPPSQDTSSSTTAFQQFSCSRAAPGSGCSTRPHRTDHQRSSRQRTWPSCSTQHGGAARKTDQQSSKSRATFSNDWLDNGHGAQHAFGHSISTLLGSPIPRGLQRTDLTLGHSTALTEAKTPEPVNLVRLTPSTYWRNPNKYTSGLHA